MKAFQKMKAYMEEQDRVQNQIGPPATLNTSMGKKWTQGWRELADLTTGIEQSDPRFTPMINLLEDADAAFECDNWAEFKIAKSQLKDMIKGAT